MLLFKRQQGPWRQFIDDLSKNEQRPIKLVSKLKVSESEDIKSGSLQNYRR